MRVLGIESSCDETGIALVKLPGSMQGAAPPRLLAQALHSQIDMYQTYSGVVPELASRDHTHPPPRALRETLAGGGLGRDAIEIVTYKHGPGVTVCSCGH
jgi:N6-L-threonylcarbamoyladenine synthase